eukprot:COSAG02_NODE_56258_length_286_cov_0.946524_2_plen_54_part_01
MGSGSPSAPSWASPGGRFDYSNVGSSLAACVVEHVVRAHGLATDYNDFVRNSIM